jgi:hypothetical protein
MNRRNLIVTLGATALCGVPGSLGAQPIAIPPIDVKDLVDILLHQTERLIPVLVGVETIIFVTSLAFRGGELLARSLSEFHELTRPLFEDPNGIADALLMPDTLAKIRANQDRVNAATNQVEEALQQSKIGDEAVRRRMRDDFETTSHLLVTKTANPKGWWCDCYAFRLMISSCA